MVKYLYDWVVQCSCFSEGMRPKILTDSRQFSQSGKPPRLNGHIPDLFVAKHSGRGAIVGEAKTAQDLENPHTHAQLVAYMSWCDQRGDSLLVVAVPWNVSRLAMATLTNLKKKHEFHTKFIVLDGLDPTIL